MAAPILWTPGKGVLSAGKKPMSIKFLLLGGGYFGFFLGGGSADFIFMGARIFLIICWLKTQVLLGTAIKQFQKFLGNVRVNFWLSRKWAECCFESTVSEERTR